MGFAAAVGVDSWAGECVAHSAAIVSIMTRRFILIQVKMSQHITIFFS